MDKNVLIEIFDEGVFPLWIHHPIITGCPAHIIAPPIARHNGIMVYKGVIFDVGGVLVSPPQEAIRHYAEMIGVHPYVRAREH